jgi:CHRD domain
METMPPRDPLARERVRRNRARQVQRRRLVLAIGVLLLIVLIVALAVGLSGRGGTATSTTSSQSTETSLAAATYTADLTGADSVPALTTKATGTLTLTYDPDAATFTFLLDIKGLTNPSGARIFEGTSGTTGAAVFTLFAGPTKAGVFSGTLAQGSVEAANFTGNLRGKTIGDLIALIEAGGAYVSVGTTSHPIDAIRGQIK